MGGPHRQCPEVGNFRRTKYTTIDVPGATNTYAHGIDSNDDVVFSWQDTSNSFHGALLMNRTFYKFDDPAGCSNGTYGDGINDHKIIVGACDTSSTTGNGFYVIY